MSDPVAEALALLDLHFESFVAIAPFAAKTGHPVPMDTRGWSQILISTLTGVMGLERKKGQDLDDGSDVKGANTWEAIDTPRFNGVLKSGTKARHSDKLESLDDVPHLYFVLWDRTPRNTARCRVWVVRPQTDIRFRAMCEQWYAKRLTKEIVSTNFQLHPPRGKDSNVIRNTCGVLSYPLFFCAERDPKKQYVLVRFDPEARSVGVCSEA